MDHEKAIKTIYDKLLGSPVPDSLYREAKNHITGCASCLQEMDLTLSLSKGQPQFIADKLAQELSRQRLNECKEMGELLKEMDPDKIQAHIRACSICGFLSQSVDLLNQAAENFTYADAAKSAPQMQTTPAVSLWREIKQGHHQLAMSLNFIFEKTKTLFTDLPRALQPDTSLGAAFAVRGAPPVPPRSATEKSSAVVIQDKDKNKAVTIQFDETNIRIGLTSTHIKNKGQNVTIDLVHPRRKRTFISQDTEIGKQVVFKITEKMRSGFIICVKYKDMSWEVPLSPEQNKDRL